jgi:hypothetical protein
MGFSELLLCKMAVEPVSLAPVTIATDRFISKHP